MIASLLALALVAAKPGVSPPPPRPQVSHAWARPTLGASGMSAVYLDITGGAVPDRLTGASSLDAASLELHQSRMEHGMMGMAPVAGLDLQPGQTVKLAPGGYHLMVMGPKHPLKVGDHLPVTLVFQRGGRVKVDAEVRATAP